jgi:hypothetical protein
MIFTVAKIARNRFQVSGVVSLHRGTEDYSRVFTTNAAAVADAAKWEKIEARNAADRLEARARRVEIVREYCAARATRESSRQLSFTL